jgi:hypothetical protein
MNVKTLSTGLALAGLVTLGGASLKTLHVDPVQASTQPTTHMAQPTTQHVAQAQSTDATGLSFEQKINLLTQNKGKFGSGDALRRFFFGDLEPIAVQPGGAGMVVNLYNKANNTTFAYCATYDVVVAIRTGRVTAFPTNEVK